MSDKHEEMAREIETAVGGTYEMPDGRAFWIDGPVAREITRRVMAASALRQVEREKEMDARRYRFLRGNVPSHSTRWQRWEVRHWTGQWWEDMRLEELDAAIGALLSKEKIHD